MTITHTIVEKNGIFALNEQFGKLHHTLMLCPDRPSAEIASMNILSPRSYKGYVITKNEYGGFEGLADGYDGPGDNVNHIMENSFQRLIEAIDEKLYEIL